MCILLWQKRILRFAFPVGSKELRRGNGAMRFSVRGFGHALFCSYTNKTNKMRWHIMDSMNSMLFLHDLEVELDIEMQRFEAEVHNRWCRLPDLKPNTIYHSCPYFEGIEDYFKLGLMRIADGACRKYFAFSGRQIELSWYSICNDYLDVLEGLCKPYSDAFEAVSSKGMERLRETKAKLENASSGRSYGYITNSFGYALAAETLNSILGALKAVENDNLAWKDATAPQQAIHTKLSNLWSSSFSSVFMEKVSLEDKSVTSSIVEHFCFSFGYTYETYLATKETQEFISALKSYTVSQKGLKERKAHSKQKQKQDYLERLEKQIAEIDSELSDIGLALWGEKGTKKKTLRKQREALLTELQAIEHPIPLQPTFTAYISHSSPSYPKFLRNFDAWLDSKEYWRFEYSEKYNDYVAYTPNNEPMFALGQGFVQKYGRFRKIGAKFEGCPVDSVQRQIAEMQYAIFEIEE